jgi:hypothetical protein
VVSAQALRWNKAGNVKAIGVQVTDPKMAKNLSNLSLSMMVMHTTMNTIKDLSMFLNIYLFLDFGHPSNNKFSKMISTG